MTDPSILATHRELAFKQVARALDVEEVIPSMRAPSIYMESYLSYLLVAVSEKIETVEKHIDVLKRDKKKLKARVNALESANGEEIA